MSWTLEYDADFTRSLRKIDRTTQRRVLTKLEEVASLDDPATMCLPYRANLAGLWKLRIGNYRVIIELNRGEMIVLALDLGHRSEVYKHR